MKFATLLTAPSLYMSRTPFSNIPQWAQWSQRKWNIIYTKSQISLYINHVWQGFLFIPLWIAQSPFKARAISEDSYQTALMRRLIWVFGGRTSLIVDFVVLWLIFFVLSVALKLEITGFIFIVFSCSLPSCTTKTCLYNVDPLNTHFCIVKLGFTGVYIIFHISAQKRTLWVLVRTASLRRF